MLVIDAPQELRKLSAKARCFVNRKPIAQSLQHGPKQAKGTVFVLPPQPRVEIVNPFVGELDGVIDAFQTSGTHDDPPK
jgi:hypothetical protein